MKPHLASFSTPALGFEHVIEYGQISAVWGHVCHEGSRARSTQRWFLSCPKVIENANLLVDAACRPSCSSTSMFPYAFAFQSLPRTKVKMTLKRGLDLMLF